MKRGLLLSCCLLALFSTSLVAAESYPYIFGLGNQTDADRGRETESDANGFSVGVGYPLSDNLYIEGIYFDNVFETGPNNGSDFYQRGLGLDLQYSFGDRESFTPFVLIGVGAADNDVVPDYKDDTTRYTNFGVGFAGRLFGRQWLRYRGEVRYIDDDFLNGMQELRYGIGIEVALGRQTEKTEVVEKIVYKTKTVEVAPRDSDGDGIVDKFDQCPGTYAGAKVDGRGCVIQQQTINIENIVFASNSAELSLNAKYVLNSALEFLRNQPNLDVEIAGHTDSVGAAEYNQQLSQRRAEAVSNYFVANGVASGRLSAKGYGEGVPVASNDNAEGRNRNRRVEMRLIPR